MWRKGTAAVLLSALFAIVAAGCGTSSVELVKGKTNVVTSFYPLYDFASKIGGEYVHVVNLVPAGVEPHDWTPKSKEISNMQKADLLVYQGAGFEAWTDDFVKSLPKDAKVKLAEASRGLELTAETDQHNAGADGGHAHLASDPHTWLSPKLAKQMAKNVLDGLIQADPAHKDQYEVNYRSLEGRFDQLDESYRQGLADTKRKDIVVSHAAFGYLCRDYGLEQKAIMGLSPDAEPSAQEMMNIRKYITDNGVKYIFFEELVSDKLAKTLAKDAGVETLVLNPLEGLTDKDAKAGADYFSAMDSNLQNLRKALQ